MKLLIFSDLHGSVPAAALLADLEKRLAPDAVLLLGDILYHGPRNRLPEGYAPGEAVKILAPLKHKILAVKGNCDSEVDQMVLPFPLASDFFWVQSEGIRIYTVHGHALGPLKLPPLEKGTVLLSGHTHEPTAFTNEHGIHMCNPGSPALPKGGHPPCYGLFEEGVFTVLTTRGEEYMRLDCR